MLFDKILTKIETQSFPRSFSLEHSISLDEQKQQKIKTFKCHNRKKLIKSKN